MYLRNDQEKLRRLAELMNGQSATPILAITDDLLYVFDAALEPEEVDFLLSMGGGNLSRSQVQSRAGLPAHEFDRVLGALLDKGHVTLIRAEAGQSQPALHIMCIFPGWFEHYLMSGKETPDRREFSRRMSAFFAQARDIPPDDLNAILEAVGPHRSVAVAAAPAPGLIRVDRALPPPDGGIYPPHSVLAILEGLPADEVISAGHCFCRQQRKMDGDPCRMDLPREACLGIGLAAEHVIEMGFGRRISRREAIDLVREAAQKGAVHQVGRMVPLTDFPARYEVDIICNCCWDCCGALGNYSRGNLPFMLKSYYIARLPDPGKCSGCGACEESCPIRAIAVDESGMARVDAGMCCGCGQCVLHCAEEALRLEPEERNVFLPVLTGSRRRIA